MCGGLVLTPTHPQVCNHKGECHCHPGWAPPRCAEPLPHMRTGRPGLPGAFTPVWPDGVQCGSRPSSDHLGRAEDTMCPKSLGTL